MGRCLLSTLLVLSASPAPAVVRVTAVPTRAVPAAPALRLAAPHFTVPHAAALTTPALAPSLSAPADAPAAPAAAPQDPAAHAAALAEQLRGTDILVIQAVKGENGRPQDGLRLDTVVEELIKRREGSVRNLERDGPASLFADTFAVEVRADAKAEVLAELRAQRGVRAYPLTELLALGSRRAALPLPSPEALAAFADKLESGTVASRWDDFADLASILETAGPERLAALPQETRDALVIPLYTVAADAVNAYNSVQGATRSDLRKRLHDASKEDGWKAREEGAEAGLNHPELRARFAPLRAHLVRVLNALDLLDTPDSRATLLRTLPHAGYAGLEFVAAPARAARYVATWLAELTGSVAETRAGLEAPAPAEGERSPWHGSSRSGGYTHVEGTRQSNHLYEWRPYRLDPAEQKNELLLLLGLPGSGADIVAPLLAALDAFQSGWPELQRLHKEKTLARERAQIERNLDHYRRQAEQNGRPYTPEQLEQLRRDMLEHAEQNYQRHDRMDGHSVVDRLLLSFGFRTYYARSVPGFDEAAYIANVLDFIRGATTRLNETGLVKQLAEGAISFLTEIADAQALTVRPELRTKATAAWYALSEKTRRLGIKLNTRLDGVIDPRPQHRLVDPSLLEDAGGDSTVWQLAPSPDGRFIAQASGDRRVRVWDASTRALVKTIALDDARQLYGDLANSLGVSWEGGRLLVTTLHDGEENGTKFAYNKIREFDLSADKATLLPEDALSEAQVRGVYVLRHNARGPEGPFYASTIELRNEQHHYLGADVRIIAADGQDLSTIPSNQLLDLKGTLLLTAAPGRSIPRLTLWDLSDPSRRVNATPNWLLTLVDQWRQRNPQGEYGWWPSISAKLGSYQGRPALLFADQGRLKIFDLETGAVLRDLEVPAGWTISPYLTDAAGTRLAAIITAPGQFSGPSPERIVIWDLTTGRLVMERDTTFVPTGMLYMRGQSIASLEFTPDGRRLLAAGRNGVQLFDLP